MAIDLTINSLLNLRTAYRIRRAHRCSKEKDKKKNIDFEYVNFECDGVGMMIS